LSLALAWAFRGSDPEFELIQPTMQRTYAFEDQGAVRWRVTLAVARFCPLVTGRVLPGRLIVLTG
jgi:hypothetical protein